MNNNIAIIGGGVSGITTGIILQLRGYRTTCYSEYIVDQTTPEDPRFASLYPAASVIPHSVHTGKMDRLFPISENIFKILWKKNVSSIKMHRHYELFEFEKDVPAYTSNLDNFAQITGREDEKIPFRTETNHLEGWVFDCLVTEWPDYMNQLYQWYEKCGGTLHQAKIKPEDIASLDSELVVNCTGVWSPSLFEDPETPLIIRGHLLHAKDAPLVVNKNGLIPSYNYTPDPDIYSGPGGKPTDVYCYPRTNGWILGGSREEGVLNNKGEWEGPSHPSTIEIDGTIIPKGIFEVNREVIKNFLGIDIGTFSDIEAHIGYRYIRSKKGEGLRLEESEEYGKKIFHNYGHGGAGITLSWGCALEIAAMIGNYKPISDAPVQSDPVLERLRNEIQNPGPF